MSKEINTQLFSSIRELIEQSKQQIAITVNATMTILYWQVGKSINSELLQNTGAEYGKQIVATLSKQLEMEYGSSFSEKNLHRMMQFATVFPENEIVATLSRQLSWSHIKELIPIVEPLKREFYIQFVYMKNGAYGYLENAYSRCYLNVQLLVRSRKKQFKTIWSNFNQDKSQAPTSSLEILIFLIF